MAGKMSESSKKPIPCDLGADDLSDRLKGVLNKPDSKTLNLGSPVSPLRQAAATSSSSGSSGSLTAPKSHSGELSTGHMTRPARPGHARSNSCGSTVAGHYPLIYSAGGGSVNSPPTNVLPTGNICPSGRILKTGMAARPSHRSDVLGTGTGHYGHGSIIRGGGSVTVAAAAAGRDLGYAGARGNVDPEELKMAGNEQYKKGNFTEALSLYDRAVAMSPENAAYRSNRAAALTGLGRVAEAMKECEEAVRLEPGYARAHHRLGSLLLRFGLVEPARKHLFHSGQPPEASEMRRLQEVEKHLNRCFEARKMGDWKSTLREVEASIAAGADWSPQLYVCRAESLLKLQQLDDAFAILSRIPKVDPSPRCWSQSKIFGMLYEAYLFYVRAQLEMSKGRFDEAVTYADKARQIDASSMEVAKLASKVKMAARARTHGNNLFKAERFTEASAAYSEGLKLDPSNAVLYCNRAACRYKLGMWERSLEDCDRALRIQPSYTKALLRRAATNSKLERWVEAVNDYEVVTRELPNDAAVAESLSHARVSLKKSRGEDAFNMKFGGEVKEILSVEQFRAAISFPGVAVVHFKTAANPHCKRVSALLDVLCGRYPSINFLKVDLEVSPDVADSEDVRIVPTLKIYKHGIRAKEFVNPTNDALEASVRYYHTL